MTSPLKNIAWDGLQAGICAHRANAESPVAKGTRETCSYAASRH